MRLTARGGMLVVFAACFAGKTLTSGPRTALGAAPVTLGHSAPWLFTGTALTWAIAVLRGLRGEVRALVPALRS
jgi:hypothetical protein